MSRWKVTIVEERRNPYWKPPKGFAAVKDQPEFIETIQEEWVDTKEEARKLIRRRFNKHNIFTIGATMREVPLAPATVQIEHNLLP